MSQTPNVCLDKEDVPLVDPSVFRGDANPQNTSFRLSIQWIKPDRAPMFAYHVPHDSDARLPTDNSPSPAVLHYCHGAVVLKTWARKESLAAIKEAKNSYSSSNRNLSQARLKKPPSTNNDPSHIDVMNLLMDIRIGQSQAGDPNLEDHARALADGGCGTAGQREVLDKVSVWRDGVS